MNETILLVDDEEGIRLVLGLSLSDAGYDVQTAACVDEALECFDRRRPDIVLTDIKMPGKTGIDLLRAIKQRDPDVEVIMLTGHGDLDLAIQSLKLEATDFLTKPINDDVLTFSLRRARERIQMRRSLREYSQDLEKMVEEKSAKLIQAERQLAALQVVMGLSSGLRSLASTVDATDGGRASDNGGLFNELPCFVLMHSRDKKILSINDLCRKKLGDLVGKNSSSVFAPEHMPEPGQCPVAVVLRTGVGRRGDQVVLDRTGERLKVSAYTVPIFTNDGDVELVLELFVDTSEVSRLREELRLTRERYRQLFDESPSSIAVIDRSMCVLEANYRYRDDFGGADGGRCHELFVHSQDECPDCPARCSFADGLPHQHETVVTARNGRQVNALIITAPLRDASGTVSEVIEMVTDITELRSLQDHLAQLGLLLGSTAHGIKGLLTALDGSVYRMGSGMKSGNQDRVQDAFKDIRLLIGRLRKMVLDILYYSKNRGLAWEGVSVAAFAEENANLVQEKAAEQDVRLIREYPREGDPRIEELGVFEADSSAASSALVNILENAIEACAINPRKPTGGGIVRFRVEADPEYVHFIVADNGPGMSHETAENLFTLFFSSKGKKGTGIGLFVANQVAKQHGGSITVSSEPGQGATFTMSFPRRLPDEVRDAPVEGGSTV